MSEVEAAAKRQQPEWRQPTTSNTGHLHLYNSLTRRKNPFFPEEGRKVNWYICGPTVYDSAHMGHARAYISFDILRRVIHSYFGYDVRYVMNVTDIDDKIIKRARQNYLVEKYKTEEKSVQVVIKDMMEAVKLLGIRLDTETNEDKKIMFQGLIKKIDVIISDLETALRSMDATRIEEAKQNVLQVGSDVLSDWLDKMHGAECTDHSIFTSLARRYEEEFHRDMQLLNVLPADVLTRVSEYVPEITSFIERIIAKGYAYESGGSVYFDVQVFNNAKNHHYAKLVPEVYGDPSKLQDALREGEGELSVGHQNEKKNTFDFALWKASKTGEPSWPSPWGPGRPGWHIECSVMASEICGHKLDIHAGGFDLKFPHHDNEIAQTEAHFDEEQWVNYFLHAGTLRIAGLKMSKSLKNFITIREALQTYTARQIRFLFLLSNWSDVLDYSACSMERAIQYEKMTNEFFFSVKHYLRNYYLPQTVEAYVKWGPLELELDNKLSSTKLTVHAALCDNIDTRTALESIRELISNCNTYVAKVEQEKKVPNCCLLRNIAMYITHLFRIFGTINEGIEIGYSEAGSERGAQSKEEELMPYLNALAQFREKIRAVAKTNKQVEILNECDSLRDNILPELGVRLEDKDSSTVIKLVDRETLMREREQQKQLLIAKQAEIYRKRAEAAAKEAQRRMPPQFLFKTAEYSQWDEQGIPTHDAKGEEVSKKQRKKLEKLWEVQDKKYREVNAKEGGGVIVNGQSDSVVNGINGMSNGH